MTTRGRILLTGSLLLLLTMVMGIIWQNVTPPWAAPDEPGHFRYIRLYAELGRQPHPQDMSAAGWERVLASMAQVGWQQKIHPQTPKIQLPPLARDPVLVASGQQIGQKPPAYYALAAFWLRLHPHWRTLSPSDQVHWLRRFSLCLHVLTVLAALFLAARLWPRRPVRMWELGMLAGMLPMVAFIGNSVNNDALTLAWGAWAFVALTLARTPIGWLIACALALPAAWLVDRTLLFLWPLAVMRAFFFVRDQETLRVRQIALSPKQRYMVSATLILIILAFAWPNPHWAAGWRRANAPQTRQNSQLYLAARGAGASIRQILSGKAILQRTHQHLKLSAWAVGQEGPLQLRLQDAAHEETVLCPLSSQLQSCDLGFTLSPDSAWLAVSADISRGTASFQLSLQDESGDDLLVNGSGAASAAWADPIFTWIERHFPLPAGYFARIFSHNAWQPSAVMRYGLYAAFTIASFWGDFGWLNYPYPWPYYLLLAALSLAALIGVVLRLRTPQQDNGILWFALLALLLILVQTWLPMLGQNWQPQGRYLFPALLPIILLLAVGWEHCLGPKRRVWLPPILFFSLLLLNLEAWQLIT